MKRSFAQRRPVARRVGRPQALSAQRAGGHAHPRTLGYLGRALSLELSAVQRYMTQAALVETWGLPEAAQRLRQETVEEMQHADRLVTHMLALGAAPNRSSVTPPPLGQGLAELLRQDARQEAAVVAFYDQAADSCRRLGDTASAELFEGLLREELEHAREMHEWLASLGEAP